ncbi:MAG: TadE/TadG family type IV pilus assembly protein [Propionicimonas sp.]
MTGQRGATSVEFAMLVPVLVLLVGLLVGGARTWLARGMVEQAAAAAVRGMSQSRSPAEANRSATALAVAQAAAAGLRCRTLVVDTDASALDRPPGVAAKVQATVRCEVPLEDVLVPGWPGGLRVEATAETALDRYRGRK